MRRSLLLIPPSLVVASLAFFSPLSSQEKQGEAKKKPAEAVSRKEKLTELQGKYDRRLEKMQERIDDLQAELNERMEEQSALNEEYATKLLDLAREQPADATALEAASHLLLNHVDLINDEQLDEAMQLLTEHHAAGPKIGEVCRLLSELEINESMKKLLERVIEKNPDIETRSWALFALAMNAYTAADQTNDAAGFAQAEKLFERIVKEVPEDQIEGTPVDPAKRFLFELRNLAVGKQAPDFESEDLQGKAVRLKDYRGKVVVLDFWATWCGFCIEMIPHNTELMKKHAGKPFTIIGISGDDDVETVKEFQTKTPMPWVQWFNGAEGGVLEEWNVQGLPMVYVLDAEGVIRYRNVRGPELDAAVETLLKASPAAKGK